MLTEFYIHWSILKLKDGNKLVLSVSDHHQIQPPSEEPFIESANKKSPVKVPKPGASPVKVTLADLTPLGDTENLHDVKKFLYDQELTSHKPGSIYYVPPGNLDRYYDDEDTTFQIVGKRVIGMRDPRAGRDRLQKYAPGNQCQFGQIMFVGLHRRKQAWTAITVLRNAKGKLLPLLKLIWLTTVWGEPWSDLKVTTKPLATWTIC